MITIRERGREAALSHYARLHRIVADIKRRREAVSYAAGVDCQMQPWAEAFYKSTAWKRCRDAYAKSVGGLCERCLKRGLYRSGEIVHHRVHLTPANINDPAVALAWANLELLCRDCHGEEHGRVERRYRWDEAGRCLTERKNHVVE